jgi:hypothetical protein
MYRSAFSYGLFVVFVSLCLVLLFFGVTLLHPSTAAAQEQDVAAAPERFGCPEEPRETEAGGSLCVSDWLDHLWLGVVSALIVIVFDAAVIYFIVRKIRRERPIGAGAS